MSNAFDQIHEAIEQAKIVNRTCDRQAEKLAQLLDGRLRHVTSWTLKSLKKQLENYNMRTGKWKDES